jgi:hypothetical protein
MIPHTSIGNKGIYTSNLRTIVRTGITYVKDHVSLFKEFNRILHCDGWFVFSTEHPFFSYRYSNIENYFETKEVGCDWHGFAKVVTMPGYYHSPGSISDALTDNGFVIERILEPKPTARFKEIDAVDYQKLMKFPLFICMRTRKMSSPTSLWA